MTLTETTVTVPGAGFATRVLRGGRGTPLVWLHGSSGVVAEEPVLEALAEHFEVVAPVHPGFTDVTELDELRDVHDLALYHDDLLATLGLDGALVVGYSFGGMVAGELAAHSPRRVGRLVLISALGLWRDEEPMPDLFAAFPRTINDLLWLDTASAPALAAREAANRAAAGRDDDPRVAALLSLAPGMTTLSKFLWPLPDKGLRRRLRRISAATLLLWGAKDRLVPVAYAADFAAGIADARMVVVDEAAHMVPLEQPDRVVELVAGFGGHGVGYR